MYYGVYEDDKTGLLTKLCLLRRIYFKLSIILFKGSVYLIRYGSVKDIPLQATRPACVLRVLARSPRS